MVIACAVTVGIWLASQFPLSLEFAAFLFVVGLLAVAGAWRLSGAGEVIWLASFCTLIAFGALRYSLSAPVPSAHSIARYNSQRIAVEGLIVEEPDVRPTFTYLRVQPLLRLGAAPSEARLDDLMLIRAVRTPPDVAWRYGDIVRVSGRLDAPPRLSTFDYREYLARQGIFSWMPRPDALIRVDEGHGQRAYAWLLDRKHEVRQAVQRMLPAPESALLNGILIGDDNAIPDDLQAAFRRTGTSHIVAISGFNVSVVIALVIPLLSRLLNPRRAALFALPTIAAYTLFVGASASVVRAALMAGIALVGMVFWRRGFTLNTLCAAAFLMLVINPHTLFDVGFQLSVLATLGLVLYADRLAGPMRDWSEAHIHSPPLRRLATLTLDGALVTLAAQLTTLPLILVVFNQLSLVALLTNVLILPLQPPIMILGGLAALVALIVPPGIAALIALPAHAFLSATISLVRWTAGFPFAAVPIYDFGTPAALLYYAVLLGVTVMALQPRASRSALARALRSRWRTVAIASASLIAMVAGMVYWYQRPDGKLHIILTGRSAVLLTPSGKQVVLAGGDDIAAVLSQNAPIWDRRIELLILPQRHPRLQRDTLPLLYRYRVEQLIQPTGPVAHDGASEEWDDALQASVAHVTTMPAGTSITIDRDLRLTVALRMPDRDGRQSIGIRVLHGTIAVDLVGDYAPVDYAPDQDLIFLGSRYADAEKLNQIRPRWLVWTDGESGEGARSAILDPRIRTVDLRTLRQTNCVSNGETLICLTR